jgi:hypothetical protein
VPRLLLRRRARASTSAASSSPPPPADAGAALRPAYLDAQATTPLDPRVLDAMLPWEVSRYGNAHSRTHAYGWEAEAAVERARAQVAALIGARGGCAARRRAAAAPPPRRRRDAATAGTPSRGHQLTSAPASESAGVGGRW